LTVLADAQMGQLGMVGEQQTPLCLYHYILSTTEFRLGESCQFSETVFTVNTNSLKYIVPTLCVGMLDRTLCVESTQDAEPP